MKTRTRSRKIVTITAQHRAQKQTCKQQNTHYIVVLPKLGTKRVLIYAIEG